MYPNFFFSVGLASIVVHEMDAMRCHEWRIFPGLSLLPDTYGKSIFMWAHVPLFSWVFWRLENHDNHSFKLAFDVFLMIHMALHIIFLFHPKNEFKDLSSWGFIVLAAVCGALHFWMSAV